METIGLVVTTAFLGSWLVTKQGRETFRAVKTEFNEGSFPAALLAHGAMILVAGAFLLTPGLLTDATGFLLLVPAVREAIRRYIIGRTGNRWTVVP